MVCMVCQQKPRKPQPGPDDDDDSTSSDEGSTSSDDDEGAGETLAQVVSRCWDEYAAVITWDAEQHQHNKQKSQQQQKNKNNKRGGG